MSIYDEEHKTLFKNMIKKDVLKSMSDKDLIGMLFENFCINDEKGSVIVQSWLLNPKDLTGDCMGEYEEVVCKLVLEKYRLLGGLRLSKTVYFSTIDKDVRRVLGKRLYNKCKEDSCFISERSNGDVEYKLDSKSYNKLRKYMLEHRNSRLCKSWTGCKDGYNVRFMIDSWQ